MGQKKENIYKDLLGRQRSAANAGFHYEACWFAYAIFENRTSSIVLNSGDHEGYNKPISKKLTLILERLEAKVVKGRSVRVKGKKIKVPKFPHLHTLKRSDVLVIKRWTQKRNDLVHELATGQLSMSDADTMSKRLSQVAERRSRELCAAARRVKKYSLKS